MSPLECWHLAVFIALAGCGTPSVVGEPAPGDAGDGGEKSPCSRPGDTYVDGLTRAAPGGKFNVTLSDAKPAPPAMGENTWLFELTDEADKPVSRATVIATSFMPDHAHSGPSVDVVELGEGEYRATVNIVLMSGLYSFRFALLDEPDDAAVYEFCVR